MFSDQDPKKMSQIIGIENRSEIVKMNKNTTFSIFLDNLRTFLFAIRDFPHIEVFDKQEKRKINTIRLFFRCHGQELKESL